MMLNKGDLLSLNGYITLSKLKVKTLRRKEDYMFLTSGTPTFRYPFILTLFGLCSEGLSTSSKRSASAFLQVFPSVVAMVLEWAYKRGIRPFSCTDNWLEITELVPFLWQHHK